MHSGFKPIKEINIALFFFEFIFSLNKNLNFSNYNNFFKFLFKKPLFVNKLI